MRSKYETSRLKLMKLRPSAKNARRITEFYTKNRSVFERYITERPDSFYTESYQRMLLDFQYNCLINCKDFRFWVFLKQDPARIIGTICFYHFIRPIYSRCEAGYNFDQEYWRHGYAKEAMTLGISLLFKTTDINRIEAHVMEENTASIRLLESLGFRYESYCRQYACIQDKWEDHLLFSLLRSRYQ